MYALNAFKTAWFTYIDCGPITKNKRGMQKFKETGD